MKGRGKRRTQERKIAMAQILAIVGVLLLIGGVLVVKAYRATGDPVDSQGVVDSPMLTTERTSVPVQSPPAPTLLPEAQLDRLLAEGRPVLAFFHSNTCVQCIKMTEIVAQVYPDFADAVALVDVNVYDENNESLLRRAGIRVIPTLIFIDRDGQGQGYIGVMEPDTLRKQLQTLDGVSGACDDTPGSGACTP